MNNIGKYGDIEVVETIYSDQVDDMEASMKEVAGKISHTGWCILHQCRYYRDVSESGEE